MMQQRRNSHNNDASAIGFPGDRPYQRTGSDASDVPMHQLGKIKLFKCQSYNRQQKKNLELGKCMDISL